MRTRAKELSALSSWTEVQPDRYEPAGRMPEWIKQALDEARDGADPTRERWTTRYVFTGASYERTLSSLDAAEVHLLRLVPAQVLAGALPSIQAHVSRYLAKDDPRRQAVDEIVQHRAAPAPDQLAQDPEAPPGNGRPAAFGQEQRDILLNAQHAANAQRLRDLMRLRQFRNVLLGGFLVFTGIAVVLGLIGSVSPTTIPLCFAPETDGNTTIVCPSAETFVGPLNPGFDLDPSQRRR